MVGDNLPPMVADPLRFKQMFGNLLSNAYRYGQPPFLVRLSATSEHIRIDVEDDGPGVPPEFRPKLSVSTPAPRHERPGRQIT